MNKLFTRYLNSAAFFDTPNDQGTKPPEKPPVDPRAAAQAERDAITVDDSTNGRDNEENENNEGDEENEGQEEEEQEEGENDEGESDVVDDKTKQPPENETDEQKTKRLAQEKEERKVARQQRKWDKLAAEKTAAEKKVQELEAKLAEKPVEGLTEEEVTRRAEELANQKLNAKQREAAQKSFEDKCDALEADAIKINKDYNAHLNELVEELGKVPGELIVALAELDNENGGEVLNHLVTNIDEAEDIFELKNNPAKLTLKLVRISDKLKAAKTPSPRQRSRVPAPIKPVNESADRGDATTAPLTGKEDMDLFAQKRAKQIAARREARGY